VALLRFKDRISGLPFSFKLDFVPGIGDAILVKKQEIVNWSQRKVMLLIFFGRRSLDLAIAEGGQSLFWRNLDKISVSPKISTALQSGM